LKKKAVLSTRVFWLFVTVESGYLFLILLLLYHGLSIITAIICIINIVFIIVAYVFLFKPYNRIKETYQKFLDQQLYAEMFESEEILMPQLQKVLHRFQFLLNKQDAIKMSKKQAEYLALQNQINPHFLYNTLEAIRGDALSEGMVNIAETAEALATFFRYTITEVENLVTLEDELENVENYFTIQQYRFGGKLKMKIIYPEQENKSDILHLHLPKLTLQPIIENAIFHGLERKKDGGCVTLRIELTQKKLLISIADDGLGMSEELTEKINESLNRVAVSYVSEDKQNRGGIALKNVNRRIKLLFGEEYGMYLLSNLNIGTDVRIELPLICKIMSE